jgi:hypothetical protein
MFAMVARDCLFSNGTAVPKEKEAKPNCKRRFAFILQSIKIGNECDEVVKLQLSTALAKLPDGGITHI